MLFGVVPEDWGGPRPKVIEAARRGMVPTNERAGLVFTSPW